jgi:type III restriction enzyme
VLASHILETFFRDDEGQSKPWLFPGPAPHRARLAAGRLAGVPRRYLSHRWSASRNCATTAGEKIYRSIVAAAHGAKTLKPILYPYDTEGSTSHVDFDTTRPVYQTDATKCHISHVVADTESWEQKMAQAFGEHAGGAIRLPER